MNLNQINKIRMFAASSMVLSNHSTLFASSEVLNQKLQTFGGILTQLEGYRQVQEQNTSGLTLSKENLRGDVENLSLRVSVALIAYATATGDANLKRMAKYTPSKLAKVSDVVLCDIAENMITMATPIVAALEIYFVTQAELDTLHQKTLDFKAAIPQNRVATSSRKASTATIDQLIRDANNILKNEIDPLVQPFQFINPDFYQQYKNARIIIDYTGRGPGASDETTVPGGVQQPA
nr:hypothetical protein [uncultured Draconibacterium sp.]